MPKGMGSYLYEALMDQMQPSKRHGDVKLPLEHGTERDTKLPKPNTLEKAEDALDQQRDAVKKALGR